jgi:prevent-host-death family protein
MCDFARAILSPLKNIVRRREFRTSTRTKQNFLLKISFDFYILIAKPNERRIDMIQATATEFKSNMGKYLALVAREEIHITKNGVDIAVLTAPKPARSWVDDITGVISGADADARQIKKERLAQKYEGLD